MKYLIAFLLIVGLLSRAKAQEYFKPGKTWLDTDGNPIEAHGGGILKMGQTYYWYGENHEKGFGNKTGISCYSSTDLLHWKNEGVAMPKDSVPPAFRDSGVCERPKVIYNERTHRYVMWMHLDAHHYADAEAGVAVAAKPAGPFRFIKAFRPIAYAYNNGDYSKSEAKLHEKENGNTFRDMNLFKDDNGKAYVIYAAESNATLYIVQLDSTYMDIRRPVVLGKSWVRIFINKYREAPALFKYKQKYFLITSAQTGWAPNAANYAVADNVLGPWQLKGNPCVGADSSTTFHSQSTYVLPAPDGDPAHFIFMADRWDSHRLQNSSDIWLPFCVRPDNTISVKFRDQWTLNIFTTLNCSR